MGKQGPCCHCGISTTPLWRNGPPDKAVLCNACGSRWRTKGTLMNYMPMHAGGCGVKSDLTDMKLPHVKKGSPKRREQCPQKRKEPCDGYSKFDYAYQKMDYQMGIGFEEEASTRSSAGSGISYSEGCVHHAFEAGRTSGAERWPPWECPVPSKRRTFMYRHRPSAKKFSRVHPAFCKLNSSMYTCAPEEDLLVEYKPSSMTVEIGLGGVFIRPPVSNVQEQESQASSLIFDNKDFDHAVALKGDFAREESQVVGGGIKANLARGKEKVRSSDPGRSHSVKSLTPNKVLLENFPYNKHDVLQSCQSPLVFLELKDIVNFDTFLGLLSDQEQLQLMKHLSSADVTSLPDSLKGMFNSVQFESALANFQLLLSEGVFDSLEAGLNRQVLQHYQQLLTVSDLTASGWMEQCSQILNRSKRRGPVEYAKGKEHVRERSKELSASGAFIPSASFAVAAAKNLPIRSCAPVKTVIEDTEHMPLVRSTSCSVHTSTSSPSMLSDATFGKDLQLADLTSKEQGSSSKDSGFEREGRSGSCFSANSFHGPNQGTGGFNSMESLIDEVDPDILLHVPFNMSFQQAEFLQQPSWSKPSTKESENKQKLENSEDFVKTRWGGEENSDWEGLFWNAPSPSSNSIHILPNGTVLNPGKMFL